VNSATRALARALLARIAETADRIGATRAKPVYIMEICGGHTHSIFRYGLDKLVHEGVEFIHGPGCPVCVLPMARVDECVEIAERPGVIFTTFGDAMRVPGHRKSLMQAKAAGCDIRMVYSPLDALETCPPQPRPRGGVLRPGVRDDDTVHGAVHPSRGARGAGELLGLLQPHHRARTDPRAAE
jgi:hydrogenase expression/formation protein HypD